MEEPNSNSATFYITPRTRPDSAPSDRLLLEPNDEYAIQKRYMSLELATMSENPPIRLPSTPARA